MVQIRLSLIVSCYNIENYIGLCLDSLLKQDISYDQYEIICINDCSTDNTRKIIQSYINLYKNLKVIDHEQNRKLGATRNTGRFAAKGEYIWFIDGDDTIQTNVLKKILSICEREQLDELFFNHDRINESNIFIEKDTTFTTTTVCSGLDYVHKYFPNQLSRLSIVWNHVYRTEYLKINDFRSPEINMGEDGPFAWRTLLNAKRVMSISDSCYVYRCNDFSMTTVFKNKPSNVKMFEKCFASQKETALLYRDFWSRDSLIAEDLKNNIKWAVNSFRPILLDIYTLDEANFFYYYCKAHSETVVPLIEYLNKGNLGYVKSLNTRYLDFFTWRTKEKLKLKIKNIIYKNDNS